MRKWALIALILLPMAGFAQSEDEGDDDGGFIQRMLESALSAEGREVRLEGFRGALSSTAEIDRIIVTDPDGTWLTAEDVSMQWRRAALLRGRVNIDEIRIGRLALPRLPQPAPQEAPTPEAGGPISLPELPVEIQLGALNLVTAEIGAPVIGEAITIGVSGSARLVSGEGNIALTIDRQDRDGTFRVAGGFANETRVLSVDVEAREPEGGLVAGLMNLPGTPSLALTVLGEGPLSDFAADLGLATNGQDRLTGRVVLFAEAPTEDADRPDDAAADQRFTADISGDITPLLDPIYHDFIGENITLAAAGRRAADGAFDLDRLALNAEALALTGTAAIGSDGWPERFDVDLTIEPSTGETVILPLPGEPTALERADLTADFDAAQGSRWQVRGQIDGLNQAAFTAQDTTLDATGTIEKTAPRVDGVLSLVIEGLALTDPALQAATGERLTAGFGLDWQPDVPTRVRDIEIGGSDYGLTGAVEIDGLGGALALVLRPDLTLRADRLSRFSGLSGQDLSGAAEVGITGSVTPLEGSFDLLLEGETQNLGVGIPEADPFLDGTGTLTVAAARDTDGLRVPQLLVETQAARIAGNAQAAQGSTLAELRAEIYDTALASPDLSGPATVDLTARGVETTWTIEGDVDLPGQTDLTLAGNIDTGPSTDSVSTATVTGQIGDLSVYAALLGQPLRGAITLEAEAQGNIASQTGALRVDSRAVGLRTGNAQADGLLQGSSDLALAVQRLRDGTIVIDRLALDAPGITAQGAGQVLGETPGDVQLTLNIPDVTPLDLGLTGPAALDVKAITEGTTFDVTGDVDLPGETALNIAAFIDTDTSQPAQSTLTVSGEVGDLSAFSEISGQPLAGRITLRAEGAGDLAAQTGDLRLTSRASDVRTGISEIDALLRGDSDLILAATRQEDGTLVVEQLNLEAPGLTADGTAQILGETPGQVDLAVRLPNLAPLVPQLPGAASLTLTGQQDGDRWNLDAQVDAPGNVGLMASGAVAQDASNVDLTVSGNAPLAIANSFLNGQTLDGPLSFDLSVRGAPGLDAVSGIVTIGNTRVAVPSAELTLEDLNGTVALNGGRAQIDIDSRFSNGGTLAVGGPVTLAAPFNADLEIALRDAIIRQSDLLETRINGAITLSGALTGGAAIGGDLLLDPLEVQIPNIGPSYSSLQGLVHEDLPAEVRQTLLSAKLIQLPLTITCQLCRSELELDILNIK